MKRLVLIDGHAILHRAFHALPPLTNKKGIQTNAIYGFMTMLLRVFEDLKPTHLAVCFDLPEPTFRQQTYTAYQAKRPEMIANLRDQIPLVHELLDTLKIPYFEVAGFEADDCIGTLAKQAVDGTIDDREPKIVVEDRRLKVDSKNLSSNFNSPPPSPIVNHLSSGLEVIIVTGDRDMLQLVNSHVKVYVPVKGLSETKTYDTKLIEEEFGVRPSQWVDVKALKGDTSDNYPGVLGIGPKTAQELIKKFDNLENLYQHLSSLDEKVATKLAAGAESAGLGKKLATIVTNVPIHLNLTSASVAGINWRSGVEYMRQNLGFKTIVERVEKAYLRKETAPISDPQKEREGDQIRLI